MYNICLVYVLLTLVAPTVSEGNHQFSVGNVQMNEDDFNTKHDLNLVKSQLFRKVTDGFQQYVGILPEQVSIRKNIEENQKKFRERDFLGFDYNFQNGVLQQPEQLPGFYQLPQVEQLELRLKYEKLFSEIQKDKQELQVLEDSLKQSDLQAELILKRTDALILVLNKVRLLLSSE